jgi:predicted nucleic acid-binding protein
MGAVFFDTNVVLYLLSADEHKANAAEALLAQGGMVSVQVLNEAASVCRRKLKLPWSEVHELLDAVKACCEVVTLSLATHERAPAGRALSTPTLRCPHLRVGAGGRC